MKKAVRIFALVMVLALSVSLFVSCGGDSKASSEAKSESDVLKGTWKTPDDADDDITWTFDGSGTCTFDNTAIKQEGTYTIKDGKTVEVKLELWDDAKIYDYEINGDEMSFIDESGLASYEKLIKQ